MHLKSLDIKNFRILENFQVNKLGRVNLIVGKNNSGKTTVLEAIRVYAGNANLRLLEMLAVSHDERIYASNQIDEPLSDEIPFQAFFSGRQFPDDDVKIVIGEIEEPNRLTIEHGYLSELSEVLYEDGEEITRNRLKRVTKDQLNDLDGELLDALFIQKNGHHANIRFDSVNTIRAKANFPPSMLNLLPCNVIPTQFISLDELADEWDKIALTDHQDTVKSALKLIAPDFLDITFVRTEQQKKSFSNQSLSRTAKVRLAGQDQPVPLNSMGDGMLRILQLILKIFSAKGGFLLIDEFENGLHYSVQKKVWELVFDLAEKLNIQVFATTHSWDCIESFAKVAIEKTAIEGVLFRVGRSVRTSDQGRVIATVFDEQKLFNITQADVEVR